MLLDRAATPMRGILMAIGVVALSFAKRREALEPNPVNIALAKITKDISEELNDFGDQTIVVAQWEIARQLEADGRSPDLTVTQADASWHNGVRYVDSLDVLNKALGLFESYGVTEVVVVANPFFHLGQVQKIVRGSGFTVLTKHKIPWVGFDNSPHNLQWWCKGPIRFLIYGVLVTIGDKIGQDYHGIGERRVE